MRGLTPDADRLWARPSLALLVAGSAALAAFPPAEAHAARIKLELPGTRGYAVRVTGVGHRVNLAAAGPAGLATYRVPGRVTRRRVVARFGRLGKVDLVFRAGGRATIETPPNRCDGRPHVTRWGAFVGVVRFNGEHGFTRVRAGRATGSVRVTPRWHCAGRSGRRGRRSGARSGPRGRPLGVHGVTMAGESDDPVVLDLIDHRHRLQGGAIGFGPGAGIPLTVFVAEIGEKRGRMQIRRTAFEFAEAENFKFDESLTEATVTPPAPFAGTGRFERTSGGTGSWTGSLSVLLPGTKRISLTPPRFGARLFRQGKSGVARPGK